MKFLLAVNLWIYLHMNISKEKRNRRWVYYWRPEDVGYYKVFYRKLQKQGSCETPWCRQLIQDFEFLISSEFHQHSSWLMSPSFSPLFCSPWPLKPVFRATAAAGFFAAGPCQDWPAVPPRVNSGVQGRGFLSFFSIHFVRHKSPKEQFPLSLFWSFEIPNICRNLERIYSMLTAKEHCKMQLRCEDNKGSSWLA